MHIYLFLFPQSYPFRFVCYLLLYWEIYPRFAKRKWKYQRKQPRYIKTTHKKWLQCNKLHSSGLYALVSVLSFIYLLFSFVIWFCIQICALNDFRDLFLFQHMENNHKKCKSWAIELLTFAFDLLVFCEWFDRESYDHRPHYGDKFYA